MVLSFVQCRVEYFACELTTASNEIKMGATMRIRIILLLLCGTAVHQSFDDWLPVTLPGVEISLGPGDIRVYEISIAPLNDPGNGWLGLNILFNDVTRFKRLQQEVEHANQELETAYEELHSANEELETTNEELQSAVEELETTNEELQSTNEELETMNEELQSTNEELETINDELRQRTEEVHYANNFLDSILRSMRGAVIVVDHDMRVKVWSAKAEDLWGLRAEEALGRNFLTLDIGLNVDGLTQSLRNCLAVPRQDHYYETTSQAINRRGRSIQCKVTCTPLFEPMRSAVTGVTLLMEQLDGASP